MTDSVTNSSAKTAPKKNYFPALDGLRLLASVNIVLLHLASSNALGYLADYKWLMPILSAPAFAAGIFYVLAGFLFASKFSDPDRRIPVIPFMFGRISKLYRLHFFMTLLMFVAMIVKFSGYTHLPGLSEVSDCVSKGLANMTHPWRSLILHLTLTWSIVPDLGMKLNEPSWSLTSFFVCYAITPWFSRWLFKQNNRTLWILFGTLFIPGILWAIFFGFSGNLWFDGYGAKYRFFHIFAPVRIFEYLFGMVLFRLYNEGCFDYLKKNFVSGIAQFVVLAAIYGSLFIMSPKANPGWNYFAHHSVPVMLYGLFLVSLLSGKGFMARLFTVGIVRKVGKASFYPYLIHLPIMTIAWGMCNLNQPANTVKFMLFVYTVSTLYSEFKTWRRKKAKEKGK
ncbi:Peptidoglycan/LPS O-acetylase OafA/YrhL, contains acyltransferase and SGNH-hydrolase domains [Fibrobacter sp. UWH9]|uniref:acyltransferase family protein n=1 Tax=unclassified Fibrobacter TaxID=2634177 RepID=UPI000921703C|nr:MULTISPECIES: acyltransferase [unclassified Fibrobacter]MCQ2099575.1 acyltransferase [Fibrobacter sp.]MDO4946334.1 acyltransferase [Fibrobacter sp.]OWV03737.1 acyltransferase [Fibrobacter sp. UWH3]OWV11633.1 acyltransferase [Fibrobacter sp. UWH1]SHG27449.1 Peptidoglycan/LPS O-acetylase OafA/YrhL, contains acyltransferase and SGNH-hydrolase domains [Fibrobacter sp. UWH9]